MTEISNENAYYAPPGRAKQASRGDEYHWVTPDTQTTGVSKTTQPTGRVEAVGYDCTAPKGGSKYNGNEANPVSILSG